jgi:microcompartment protein CcmL/EutN
MEALALIEIDSIAAGIAAVDEVMKMARVELIASQPVDPGKYIILFGGDVGSVESSFARGCERAGDRVVDRVLLPQVHESVVPLLTGGRTDEPIASLGVVETATVAAVIRAADAAAKAAEVTLLRIHLARRIGGKGFVILTGQQTDVEAAVAAGADAAGRDTDLFAEVVIPAPTGEIFGEVTREWLER